jgi:hypothetical protein
VTDLEAQQALVGVVTDWLASQGNASEFVSRYWNTRDELLDSNPGAFDGPVAEELSHMDVAVHSFWPEPESEGEIGEADLRTELGDLIEHLRTMGFPLTE